MERFGRKKTIAQLKKELENYGIPSVNVTDKDINKFKRIGYDSKKIEAELKRLNAVDMDQFKRLANYAYQGGLIGMYSIPKPIGRFKNPGRRRYNPADYSQGGLFRGLVNDVEDGSLMGS